MTMNCMHAAAAQPTCLVVLIAFVLGFLRFIQLLGVDRRDLLLLLLSAAGAILVNFWQLHPGLGCRLCLSL